MSFIKIRILQSNFELIRDRIGQVLADEFLFQQTFGDTDIANLKVWVSRTIPFDKTEPPAINVNYIHGDFYSEDSSVNTNVYKYSIDCHASAKSNVAGDRGDAVAMMRLHKIMGIASRILNDTQYRTLAFPPPSIQTRWIETADIAEVMRGDAESIMFGRLVFAVRINEDITLLSTNIIKGYDAQVKMDLSDKGYYFKTNNYA